MASSVQQTLYDCVKLLEIKESTPVVGGETPFNSIDVAPQSSASTSITHSCFKETSNYSVLALICDNGYVLLRLEPFLQRPIVKQLKWYEGRGQHILDVAIDPLGEWLVCACLDGCLYLLPILSMMLPDSSPTHMLGSLTDLTVISSQRRISPPTSIVWWESIDGGQICIVGSELGEITFFNMQEGKELAFFSMRGCVDQLMLAKRSDHTTHLLINLRGGEWWWMLLEERYHEEVGTSYSDVQESGFEVVYDDAVLRSFLSRPEAPMFEPKLFQVFNELTKLSTPETVANHERLGALNLKSHNFELFSYDFELFGNPLFSFKIPPDTTSVLWTDKLLFTISHNDESDELSFTLSVISNELAQRTNSASLPENAVIQQFRLRSEASIVGFYLSTLESPKLAREPRDLATPTNLNGCVIVTSDAVYYCKQKCSPESIFLKMALSSSNLHLTDEVAIAFKLDICTLYKAAAMKQIQNSEYRKALKLFEQSKCPPLFVIKSFAEVDRVPELLSFLLNILYNEEGQSLISQSRQLQDVLIQCLIHQSLSTNEPSQESALREHLSQFINDKFLYDHSVAMKMLIKSGMKAQLFELAQTHGKIGESVDMLMQHSNPDLSLPLQSLVATSQFAEVLATHAKGLILRMLAPVNFGKCVLAKPSILVDHLAHLISIHAELDPMMLMKLVSVLDPSHHIIHPQLQKARSTIKRSNSTGSLFSVASGDGVNASLSEAGNPADNLGPSLEAYIEAFLITLVTLISKRKGISFQSTGLLTKSPLADRIGTMPEDKVFWPTGNFSDGSKALHGNIIACGLNHGAMTIDDDLYTWGSTHSGKLGHGDIEGQPIAAPLKVETLAMLNAKVIAVACGAEHTIVLCQEGVYSWGSSTHGQLGVGDTLKRSRPVPIPSFSNISLVSVACGQYHSLALDEDQRVWSWGWSVHGQTGVGATDDLLVPVIAKIGKEVGASYIEAGFNHSAVIDKEGKLYTFGNGMYGQLGHGDQDKKTTPTLVQTLADKYVYLVACGNSHTLAVCNDQSIYYWGKNFHKPHPGSSPQSLRQYARSRRDGATSPSVLNALLPVQMQGGNIEDVIIQIDCGNYHCLILTVSGKVYSWGNNIHGQIGHTHTPELSQPRLISKLESHVIKTISCGDEFSIAIDDGGISWVWGRDELGQLGMEFPEGLNERRKVCIFAPNPNPQIPKVLLSNQSTRKTVTDSIGNSLLAIDLQWDLPDFANIGSNDISYCQESLRTAFESLHGFYRTGNITNHCLHLEDYQSLADIMTIEKHWPEVLYWRLKHFTCNEDSASVVLSTIKEVLWVHLSETTNHFNRDFIIRTSQMLNEVFLFWNKHSLEFGALEDLLKEKITELSYPLSMIIKSNKVKFSFNFVLAVTMAISKQINAGVPSLEELVKEKQQAKGKVAVSSGGSPDSGSYRKPTSSIDTVSSDSRLWKEVLRNLSKDVNKHTAVTVAESSLSSIRKFRERNLEADISNRKDGIVAFSCGHAFSEIQFQEKVLIEFFERIQDFLAAMPHMISFLQLYYKQCSSFTSGCPYCVFQYLRTAELKRDPATPIRPWNVY